MSSPLTQQECRTIRDARHYLHEADDALVQALEWKSHREQFDWDIGLAVDLLKIAAGKLGYRLEPAEAEREEAAA